MIKSTASKKSQARITTLVSAKQKKQAERMAKELSGGSVGELIRALLVERHEIYIKRKKSAKLLGKPRRLVRGKHVAATKPARKGSTRNPPANKAKSPTPKDFSKSRLVSSRKPSGHRARSTAKKS